MSFTHVVTAYNPENTAANHNTSLASTSKTEFIQSSRCPDFPQRERILDCVLARLPTLNNIQSQDGNASRSFSLILPKNGMVTIQLFPISVYDSDAMVGEIINGSYVLSKPEERTVGGNVIGDNRSHIRITFLDSGFKGYISTQDDLFWVEPASEHGIFAPPGTVIIYRDDDFISDTSIDLSNDVVPEYEIKTNGMSLEVTSKPIISPTHFNVPSIYYARVTLYSDDEFRSKHGNNWQAEQQARLNNIDYHFYNQLETHLRIAGQFELSIADIPGPELCTDPADPPNDVIWQFQAFVQFHNQIGPPAIRRDLSVLMSGRSFSETKGCAWRQHLGQDPLAYAVTATEGDWLPDHEWVLAHEMGHVFGGDHAQAHECFGCPYPIPFYYSIMTPTIPFCKDRWFSNGQVDPRWNNQQLMINHIADRLERIGQNIVLEVPDPDFTSSGDLWGHTPDLVGDGDMGTNWWANTEVSWIQIQLTDTVGFQWSPSRYIYNIVIHGWHGYYLADFDVLVSEDGIDWTNVYEGGSLTEVDFEIYFRATPTRFIRVEIWDIYQNGGLNELAVIREIEAYETTNVASWRWGSSSGDLWGHYPQLAVDGNFNTYWWGTSSSGSWIRFEFPATCVTYYRLRLFQGYGVLRLTTTIWFGEWQVVDEEMWPTPQIDVFLEVPVPDCGIYAIQITFIDNAQGGHNDFPVVRELDVYYGGWV